MKLVDRKETENSGSSTIIVADVKKDDFGNYTCRAVNKIGTGEATAVVSGYPDRPTMQVEIDPNGESAIIHLQAKSIEPVVDFQLDIMKTGPDAEKNARSTIIPPNPIGPALDDSTYIGKYRLEKLDPGNSYYLTVKARNSNGYGPLSAKSFRPEKVEAAKQTENSHSSTVARKNLRKFGFCCVLNNDWTKLKLD
uniref:Ig-like domain-containing protein n=1 Tax=Romanomermis culicivorax TaxID=13658 RepID=A0A915K8H1_ROMCU